MPRLDPLRISLRTCLLFSAALAVFLTSVSEIRASSLRGAASTDDSLNASSEALSPQDDASSEDEPGSDDDFLPVETPLVENSLGAPMRIRNYTYPTFAVLGFSPQPAAPLGKGRWAFEFHASAVNNFQVSPAVEEYLEERGGPRRPLSEADKQAIAQLPNGDGFYIDAEINFADFIVHYGLTKNVDLGLSFYYVDHTTGLLDGTIFDFHDQFGYGQQGRNFVADDQYQVLLALDGERVVEIDGPPDSGLSDPSIYLRYSLPSKFEKWAFNIAWGIKMPFVDDPNLSSGSFDTGVLFTADRRSGKNALIFNLSLIDAGKFDDVRIEPPFLPSLNVAWLHGFGKKRNLRFFLQALYAEHVLREIIDSELSRPEFQLTGGFKWDSRLGVFGIGLTENLVSYDNTPDIGIHFSWGYLTR